MVNTQYWLKLQTVFCTHRFLLSDVVVVEDFELYGYLCVGLLERVDDLTGHQTLVDRQERVRDALPPRPACAPVGRQQDNV